MATVKFTDNLKRHIDCPQIEAEGETVRQVLDNAFKSQTKLKGYVLDDQGCLRKHMTIAVNGQLIKDRDGLSDSVAPHSEVFILQALSGG